MDIILIVRQTLKARTSLISILPCSILLSMTTVMGRVYLNVNAAAVVVAAKKQRR